MIPLFSFFIHFSLSALVGVDIGSEHLRASILRPGKQTEILLDQNSRRTFSTIMTIVPIKGEEIPDCFYDVFRSFNVGDSIFQYDFNE